MMFEKKIKLWCSHESLQAVFQTLCGSGFAHNETLPGRGLLITVRHKSVILELRTESQLPDVGQRLPGCGYQTTRESSLRQFTINVYAP